MKEYLIRYNSGWSHLNKLVSYSELIKELSEESDYYFGAIEFINEYDNRLHINSYFIRHKAAEDFYKKLKKDVDYIREFDNIININEETENEPKIKD